MDIFHLQKQIAGSKENQTTKKMIKKMLDKFHKLLLDSAGGRENVMRSKAGWRRHMEVFLQHE